MFRYRLHWEDGSEAGEATYAQNINVGDEIHVGKGERLRVLDVVPNSGGGGFAVRRATARLAVVAASAHEIAGAPRTAGAQLFHELVHAFADPVALKSE
jgi:hypothetical protein